MFRNKVKRIKRTLVSASSDVANLPKLNSRPQRPYTSCDSVWNENKQIGEANEEDNKIDDDNITTLVKNVMTDTQAIEIFSQA